MLENENIFEVEWLGHYKETLSSSVLTGFEYSYFFLIL